MAQTLPQSEAAEDLLRRVAGLPSISVERNGCRATLRHRVAAVAIAKLDLATAGLVVDVPRDMAGALHRPAPLPRPENGAVRVNVADRDRRRAAIALLRWRIDVERFGPQYRNASP
jgi:hypothetical protein